MSAVSADAPQVEQESSISTPSPAATSTIAIVEITMQLAATDTPRDYVTNTFHFDGPLGATAANWQALTDAILTVWQVSPGPHWGYGGVKTITVNAYDMADPKPRPEKAHSLATLSGTGSNTFPRQVALAVSFYAARNLKRQRGRVYLIPWNNAGPAERPNTTVMTGAMGLVTAVATAAAGLTPVWSQSVYSTVAGVNYVVDHWWVNDVWDTQRRRAPKESARLHNP